jgi:hypothetical protein
MPFVPLTADTDIGTILGELWMFNPKTNGSYATELKNHFAKMHKEGKIRIITDNLLDDNKWDSTLRIHIKEMTAHELVKRIITPIMTIARPTEINMVSHKVGVITEHNVIEFWWD